MVATFVFVSTLGLIAGLVYKKVESAKSSQRRETKLGNYSRAAIATDAEPCAKIGV